MSVLPWPSHAGSARTTPSGACVTVAETIVAWSVKCSASVRE
ncbi:Uncharacterised protein [Mycobacteroides abscessus]|nr:Uncharacterised protein [Mycobacteroides abscessus]